MTQTTSWMAPTRRLGQTTITVRNAWQHLSMTLVLVMLAMTAQQAWASTFSGGSGTKDNPFIISTPADLVQLSTDINNSTSRLYEDMYFSQSKDIDMSGINFVPIGLDEDENHNHRFRGRYNG